MGTGWFLVLVIIGIVLLVIASIFSAIGAGNANSSTKYATNSNIRNAGQMLTIAAIIGWSSFAVLLTIILVAFFSKAFTFKDFTSTISSISNPSESDVVQAVAAKEALARAKTTSNIIFTVLIIVGFLVFTLGILCAIAATDLSKVPDRDDKANSAYTQAIVGACLGIGTVGILVVATIAYASIKSARKKQEEEAKTIINNSGAKVTDTKTVTLPQQPKVINVDGKPTLAKPGPSTTTKVPVKPKSSNV